MFFAVANAPLVVTALSESSEFFFFTETYALNKGGQQIPN